MKNELLILIEKTMNRVSESNVDDNFKYNLNLYLELIEFSVGKKHFFSTVSLIRCYRNIIYSLIREMHFMPIYGKVRIALKDWKAIQDFNLQCINYTNEHGKDEEKDLYNKLVILLENDEIQCNSKNIEKKANFANLAWVIYYGTPVYFHNEKLDDINLDNFKLKTFELKILKKVNEHVSKYIDKLIDPSSKERLIKANLICNNGIHKNNFDSEDFKQFEYDENSIGRQDYNEILADLINVYNNILFTFLKKKNV